MYSFRQCILIFLPSVLAISAFNTQGQQPFSRKEWIKKASIRTVNHLASHATVYTLGSYFSYYHLLNKQAVNSIYSFEPSLSPYVESNLQEMCNKLNLDRNHINAREVRAIKEQPFFPFLFSREAHIVGTNGIVFNYSRSKDTIAHELTHLKNKHAYIIAGGALLSPIVVDSICYGLAKCMDRYKGNNTILKKVISIVKSILLSPIVRGAMSFLCALKILHACERNADTSYAQRLCNTDDLCSGRTHGSRIIPFLNIDIDHIWHPPV